ncbi:MAG: hypothetical protein KGL39_17165 [Patescibacteria group bacterium]|nr:hypothetical protein [Patescibacteria group bacterium]
MGFAQVHQALQILQRPIGIANTWYVDGTNGNDANSGIDPGAAVKTLGQAFTLASAVNGDTIVILPGYTQTLSDNTFTIAKSGLKIVGLGRGTLRPTFTLDTGTTSTINVTAASISIENCLFVADYAAIVTVFTLTNAPDFQLKNCQFNDTSSILNALAIVTTDATSHHADGLMIDSCVWLSLTASAAISLVKAAGTNDRFSITNNYVSAATTSGAAIIPISAGKVLTNLKLLNNEFLLTGAAGTSTGYVITTNGSTNSGLIDGNQFRNLATSPLLVTASSGFSYGINYHADAADASGYILPAQDS